MIRFAESWCLDSHGFPIPCHLAAARRQPSVLCPDEERVLLAEIDAGWVAAAVAGVAAAVPEGRMGEEEVRRHSRRRSILSEADIPVVAGTLAEAGIPAAAGGSLLGELLPPCRTEGGGAMVVATRMVAVAVVRVVAGISVGVAPFVGVSAAGCSRTLVHMWLRVPITPCRPESVYHR